MPHPTSVDPIYAGHLPWDIDRDVIRGRTFDLNWKLLPDGLSLIDRLDFLDRDERRLMSRIQACAYCHVWSLLDRFAGARILDVSGAHAGVDWPIHDALVRFTHEEMKHDELFRRVARLVGDVLPSSYRLSPEAEALASSMLRKSTWAVLGFVCQLELVTQVHYRQSLEPDRELSDLFKDVLFFHAKDEWPHAKLHQAEWQRQSAKLAAGERERGIAQLVELLKALDTLLVLQATGDVEYFVDHCNRGFTPHQTARLHSGMLRAYRWQFIGCGLDDARSIALLSTLLDADEMASVRRELPPVAPRPTSDNAAMASALRTADFWRALRGMDAQRCA